MPQAPDPNPSAPPRRAKCSRCGVEFSYVSVSTHASFPFCSQRCRDVDLGHWFTGKYAIPCEEPLTEDDSETLSPEHDAT